MTMRRLVVNPYNFGSNDGYGWLDEDAANPDAAIYPHHDYCGLYAYNYSLRVMEPGRLAVSTPGIYNPQTLGDASMQAPELPMKTTIHGIKGAAYFRFDGTEDGVGTWVDQFGDPFAVQPSPADTYCALAGMPMAYYEDAGNFNKVRNGDCNPAFRIPLFCAHYAGTYKQLDNLSGWEIDSGPADDPDTLLALNITSPQVLESMRIKWWDLDWVPLPRPRMEDWERNPDGLVHVAMTPGSPHWHKYALDLSANRIVEPDQVLWLHWMTGVIRLPVALPDQAGGTGAPTLTCAFYEGHKFSISVQATMLVTPRIKV